MAPAFFVVVTGAVLASVVLPVWAVVDAASRSRVAFYLAGYNRTAWIVVLVSSFFFGIGLFPALVYLIGTRRKVAAQALAGY